MIISVKAIRKPRVTRQCEDCRNIVEGPIIRLYGAAWSGDPPYVLYVCPACVEKTQVSRRQPERDKYARALASLVEAA